MAENENAIDIINNRINEIRISEFDSRRDALDSMRATCRQLLDLTTRDKKDRNNELSLIMFTGVTCLNDQQEDCRETALAMLLDMAKSEARPRDFLKYVLPTLDERLSSNPPLEQSETIRLSMIRLLASALVGDPVSDFQVETAAIILCSALKDTFVEVKKLACSCLINSSERLGFHRYSETLLSQLMEFCLHHQQWKVREAAILAIGAVTSGGSTRVLEITFHHVAKLAMDFQPMVRMAMTRVASEWMLKLPDRYSYFHFLIPLVLISTSDHCPEVQKAGVERWNTIGKQYEAENKTELKDQLDVEKPLVDGYPRDEVRPTLGCRVLVLRNLSAILPAVFGDLRDSSEQSRSKGAQLLYTLLLNAEDGLVHQLPIILSGLERGFVYNYKDIILPLQKSARLVGLFCSSRIWWPIVKSYIAKNQQRVHYLSVLAALIGGCSHQSDLKTTIADIIATLSKHDISEGCQTKLKELVYECTHEIILKEECCAVVPYEVFRILLSLLWFEELQDRVNSSLLDLVRIAGAQTLGELFKLHSTRIIAEIKDSDPETWSPDSENIFILSTVLKHVDLEVNVNDSLVDGLDPSFLIEVLPILVTISKRHVSFQFRCFSMLTSFSYAALKFQQKPVHFFVASIRDIILPNLIWSSGNVPLVLREGAFTCLSVTLANSKLTPIQIRPVMDDIVNRCIESIVDENENTRLICSQILNFVCYKYGELLEDQKLLEVVDELLKKFDDDHDKLRVVAAGGVKTCLTAWFARNVFVKDLHVTRLTACCRTALVYLDDDHADLRAASYAILETMVSHQPDLLKEELFNVKGKITHQQHFFKLDRLLLEMDFQK